MALGSFIGAGRSLDAASQRVAAAEELGYESVYVTHIAGRDSVTTPDGLRRAQRAYRGSAPA